MDAGDRQTDVIGRRKFVALDRTSIDFGAFDQGVMSVGGNVMINAGGNIADLGVSLPTTWYKDASGTPVTAGGGNLTEGGWRHLERQLFRRERNGCDRGRGRIGSDVVVQPWLISGQVPVSVSTLLATQDGIIDVVARQGADIGGVFNPSYLQIGSTNLQSQYAQYADAQAYSSDSAVNITTTTGDVVLARWRRNKCCGEFSRRRGYRSLVRIACDRECNGVFGRHRRCIRRSAFPVDIR